MLQRAATRCNTLQHTDLYLKLLEDGTEIVVQLIAIHCNMLQHAATCCNTLQHTDVYLKLLEDGTQIVVRQQFKVQISVLQRLRQFVCDMTHSYV